MSWWRQLHRNNSIILFCGVSHKEETIVSGYALFASVKQKQAYHIMFWWRQPDSSNRFTACAGRIRHTETTTS